MATFIDECPTVVGKMAVLPNSKNSKLEVNSVNSLPLAPLVDLESKLTHHASYKKWL